MDKRSTSTRRRAGAPRSIPFHSEGAAPPSAQRSIQIDFVEQSIMVDRMDVEQLTTLARATASEDPLVGLDATVQVRKEMERVEAVLVRRARNQGATWVDIAAVLGVSKQAIHKKYGGRGLFGSQK